MTCPRPGATNAVAFGRCPGDAAANANVGCRNRNSNRGLNACIARRSRRCVQIWVRESVCPKPEPIKHSKLKQEPSDLAATTRSDENAISKDARASHTSASQRKAQQKTKADKDKKEPNEHVDKSKKRKTTDDGAVKWGKITHEAKKGPLGQAFAASSSKGEDICD